MNKIPVFILSYTGINELDKWLPTPPSNNIIYYIIDNGRQNIPERLKPYVIHTTKENIFCAGGWNLACSIGFKSLGYDKIIITQDDLKFDNVSCIDCLGITNPNAIVGGRNDYFFYSFFALHKETYYTLGPFDENYLFVTCEDADFFYRAHLKNISHLSINRHLPNMNLTSKELSWKYGNYEYLISKWGPEKTWGIYTYKTPFDGKPYPKFRQEYWKYFTENNHNNFMSENEYDRFLLNNK